MRFAPLLAALTLGAVCACAQMATPSDQAQRLLPSQSLRDKAWGAWYAGASHDPALREPLLVQLKTAQALRNSGRDTEGFVYIQALFDALIQIPGTIPSDIILPFEESWRPEILILLSRAPAADGVESALLNMREHSMREPEWAAVNDLLFSVSSKPFFQETLEEIRVTHQFVVADQLVFSCGGAFGCGGSTRHFPKDFPPVALYQLGMAMTQAGDTLVMEQPVLIHYRRTVVPTNGEVPWSDCDYDGLVADARQALLARFFSAIGAHSADESYNLFRPRTTINWHDAAQALAEMDQLMAAQAASIQALIVEAQERGLVQSSGMSLTIQTSVVDARRDKSLPLPAIAPREVVIP